MKPGEWVLPDGASYFVTRCFTLNDMCIWILTELNHVLVMVTCCVQSSVHLVKLADRKLSELLYCQKFFGSILKRHVENVVLDLPKGWWYSQQLIWIVSDVLLGIERQTRNLCKPYLLVWKNWLDFIKVFQWENQ